MLLDLRDDRSINIEQERTVSRRFGKILALIANKVADMLEDGKDLFAGFPYSPEQYRAAAARLEDLGADQERVLFEEFFAAATVLPLSDAVLQQAIKLRQIRKMSLGDALVAATALVHGLMLLTRNVKDFEWVPGLRMTDPVSSG